MPIKYKKRDLTNSCSEAEGRVQTMTSLQERSLAMTMIERPASFTPCHTDASSLARCPYLGISYKAILRLPRYLGMDTGRFLGKRGGMTNPLIKPHL